DAVAEYLAVRFAVGATDRSALHRLAHLVHRRTEGNPLFMVTVVEDLVRQGVIARHGQQWALGGREEEALREIRETLRQLIEQQIERLSVAERQVLEVASVASAECSAAAVAAGAEMAIEEVEACCSELARREQFLRARGSAEWPDGTLAAHYSFGHAL